MWLTIITLRKSDLDMYMYVLYNNPSYFRILIGSCLWSIRGQMHDWRHHYKVFPSVFLSGGRNFENLSLTFTANAGKRQKWNFSRLSSALCAEESKYLYLLWIVRELRANCIAAKMCLWHYTKLIRESPTTDDKNFHRHQRSFHSKLQSNGL